MPEYFVLFSALCDALEELEALKQKLVVAMQYAEELYISRTD